MTEQELDAIWQSLTPAAKASWVATMQPDDYDPADPGFTPDPERCPAGGAHRYEVLEDWRGRRGWGCAECGAPAPETPEYLR